MGANQNPQEELKHNFNLKNDLQKLSNSLNEQGVLDFLKNLEKQGQSLDNTFLNIVSDSFLQTEKPNYYTFENKDKVSKADKMIFVLYYAIYFNINGQKNLELNKISKDNLEDYFVVYLNARQNSLKTQTDEKTEKIEAEKDKSKKAELLQTAREKEEYEKTVESADLTNVEGITSFFSEGDVNKKIQDLLKYKQENKELFKEKFSRDAFQMYLQNNLPKDVNNNLNEDQIELLNPNLKRAFLTFGVLFGNYRYGLDLTKENLENNSIKEFLKQNVKDIYNIADFDKSKESVQKKVEEEEKKEIETVKKDKEEARKRAKENYDKAIAEAKMDGDDISVKKAQAEMQQRALEEYTKQIDSVKVEGIKAVYGKYVSEGNEKDTRISNVASILKNKFPDSAADNGVEELALDYTKLTAGDVYALKKEGFFIPALFLIDKSGSRPKSQEDLNTPNKKFIVTFKSLGSNAINNDLEQTIGAGDLLIDYGKNSGNIPTKVKIGNEEGELKLDPRVGYYSTKTGNYLPIYSGFEIEILESKEGNFPQINQAFDERAKLQRKEDFDNYMQNQIANNYGADSFELKPMSDSTLDKEILDSEMNLHGIIRNLNGKYIISKEQQETLKKEYYNISGFGSGDDGGFESYTDNQADEDKGKDSSWCSYIARVNAKKFGLKLNGGAGANDAKNSYPDNYTSNVGPLLATKNTLNLNNIPENADFIDIFTDSDTPKGKIYGHRAIAYKWGGNWFVLDPYFSNKGEHKKAIPINDYLQKHQGPKGVTKVAYYDSPRITENQANNGIIQQMGSSLSENDNTTYGKLSSFLSGSHSNKLAQNPGIVTIVKKYCEQYGIPPALVFAVIKQESGYNPEAISHAGAKGLIQLMPGTAREMGVNDSFDIEQNIMGGVKYLKKMSSKFNGNLSLILAGYNAGPGNVRKYNGIPPFKETQNYVYKIMKDYKTLTSMGI